MAGDKNRTNAPSLHREALIQRLQSKASHGSAGLALPQLISDQPNELAPFPLTAVQQAHRIGRSGFFDLGMLSPNILLELEFEVSVEFGQFSAWLRRAVQTLVERHPMLRVAMLPHNHQAVRPVAPSCEFRFEDLSGMDAAAAQERIAVIRNALSQQKRSATNWPLFDLLLFRLDATCARFIWCLDALLTDGPTAARLGEELVQIVQDPAMAQPPLACTYRDYAVAWHAFQSGDLYQRSKRYWLERLKSLHPAPILPTTTTVSPQTPSGFIHIAAPLLTPAQWVDLKKKGREHGLTPAMVLTAAYVEVVAAYSGSDRFTIGLVGTFRPPVHPQINSVIGNFNTISPLVVDHVGRSFAERALTLQRGFAADLEHRFFSGFEIIRELKRIKGGGSRVAMPILFNFLLHPKWWGQTEQNSTGDVMVRQQTVAVFFPQVQLNPTIIEAPGGGLKQSWMVAQGIFPDGMINAMMEHYTKLLQYLASQEEGWGETSGSRIAVRDTWGGPPVGLSLESPALDAPAVEDSVLSPLEASLAELWEEVLGTRPSSPAQDFFQLGGTSLSFIELVHQIERVFHKRVPAEVLTGPTTVRRFAQFLQVPQQ